MLNKLVSFAILPFITYVSPKIIFNQNEFIIEFKVFSDIQNAVKSGDLTCGLVGENLDVHTNKFNGTHVIFAYERACFLNKEYNYTKLNDVYSNPFVCFTKFADPIEEAKMCNTEPRVFAFNDTCAIKYEKACEKFGPCIGEYKEDHHNGTKSKPAVTLHLGNDTVEFTTKDIQHAIKQVIFCDRFEHTWGKNETQYDDDEFVLFRYGDGTCGIVKVAVYACPCCEPSTFDVQAKYGHKLNDKAVNKTDTFNK